jgi:hypothetical protein
MLKLSFQECSIVLFKSQDSHLLLVLNFHVPCVFHEELVELMFVTVNLHPKVVFLFNVFQS